MLENFWFNVNYGINHVLDINGYDHVLFLILLSIPYLFNNWKRVLLLVSLFTLGHTLSLVLAAYSIVSINGNLVEFLIPITILVAALYNVLNPKQALKNQKINVLLLSALCFGLIHGLGFAREFSILVDGSDNTLLVLIAFALGIELSQVIIVFAVLFLSFLGQTLFRFNRRDWVMVISSIVIGLVIPIIIESELFSS